MRDFYNKSPERCIRPHTRKRDQVNEEYRFCIKLIAKFGLILFCFIALGKVCLLYLKVVRGSGPYN